jgi:pyrroloquinoline quinone biosynthesis protein B
MLIRILGSAAGGGVPQWNCGCRNCEAVRAGSAAVRPRTQSSVAVSADGRAWFLLNVSPDVRQQILAFAALGPTNGESRGSSIAGCVLTDAELDHTSGLLLLREGGPFRIHCTETVQRWLTSFLPIALILASFAKPTWNILVPDAAVELRLPSGAASGLRLRALEVDRHVPRFVREETGAAAASVIALEVEDSRSGGRLLYAPCVTSLGPELRRSADTADVILLDGTFWDDDEPLRCGIGSRTARAMGHLPVNGPDGSLTWLSERKAFQRGYIHINNTNPMLNETGPEHRLVTEHGVRVGADGDSFEL